MNIGDYIEVLDDTIKGHIVRLTPQQVTVLTTEGFELTFRPEEIIVIEEEAPLKGAFTNIDEESLRKDVVSKRKNKSPLTKKERNIPPMEVDLQLRYAYPTTRNRPPAVRVCYCTAHPAGSVHSRRGRGSAAHRIRIPFGALLQCYFLRCRIRQIRCRRYRSIYLSKCKINDSSYQYS